MCSLLCRFGQSAALICVGERANASEDELTRRRRDGDDGGDRDEARTDDGQAGIEQARTARMRLGLPRTARSDSLKLKQRGHNDATSNSKHCWKRIPTP